MAQAKELVRGWENVPHCRSEGAEGHRVAVGILPGEEGIAGVGSTTWGTTANRRAGSSRETDSTQSVPQRIRRSPPRAAKTKLGPKASLSGKQGRRVMTWALGRLLLLPEHISFFTLLSMPY